MADRSRCPEKCTRFTEKITSPCMSGSGPEGAKIVLVGEAPGQVEDKYGKPFLGPSGKLLNSALEEVAIDREVLFITNCVRCGTAKEDRSPTKTECKKCRFYLEEELKRIKPWVIATLGGKAMESVIGKSGITKFRNSVYWSEEFNSKVVTIYHPAHILRNPGLLQDFVAGFKLLKREAEKKEFVVQEKKLSKYLVADTEEKIRQVLAALGAAPAFSFDFETSGLDYYGKAEILCISVSWQEGLGVVIPWDKLTGDNRKTLERCLASTKLIKIGHNIKFDMHFSIASGIRVGRPFEDVMLEHHLIDENSLHGLDDLVLKYTDMGEYWVELDDWRKQYAKDNKIKKDQVGFGLVPKDILYPYAARDADATFRVHNILSAELSRQGLTEFYMNHVLPTTELLLQMEHIGIKIDREQLAKLVEEYSSKRDAREAEVLRDPAVSVYEQAKMDGAKKALSKKYAGSKMIKSRYPNVEDYVAKYLTQKLYKFNLKSVKQLGELFFDKKHLGIKSEKKTEKGKPALDEEVLNLLSERVPFAKALLEYRQLVKYVSTYLVGIYEKSSQDGRIHTEFLQHITVTGRNSSKNPNMQNMPRDAKDLKDCFIADDGFVFVKADLAQAEFRCWAHYSEDEDMLADISSGLDIHRRTASEVFGVLEEEVTSEQRTAAKNAVFGLMYGRGAKAIAAQYKIDEGQAEEIKNLFFSKYPKARRWLSKQVDDANMFKCVKSWLGRVRRLPNIDSEMMEVSAEAERQAKNSPIQSLASDMNNRYFVTILRRAKKENIKCYPAVTIHDANIVQVEEEKVSNIICIMKDVVATAFPEFKCPMKLDFEVGKTLGHMDKWEDSK